MDRSFLQELENSLYILRPLPLHTERSLEAGFAAKAVTCLLYTSDAADD